MSHYSDTIKTAIGRNDDALAEIVEDFMRLSHSTLDALSLPAFTLCAQVAYGDVWTWHTADQATIDETFMGLTLASYCEGMGLDYPAAVAALENDTDPEPIDAHEVAEATYLEALAAGPVLAYPPSVHDELADERYFANYMENN